VNDVSRTIIKSVSNFSPESARDVRARTWAYVFQCWRERQRVAKPAQPSGCDDHRNSEKDKGGDHVEQLYDRSSQIT
jgi:hypothetical protein